MSSPTEWLSCIQTVRAPLILLVLAGLAFVLPDQTGDMLAALQDGAIGPLITFHVTLAVLATSAWYWSRTLLAARFMVADNRVSRERLAPAEMLRPYEQVPRLIFILAVLIGIAIAVRSAVWVNLACLVVWATLLGVLVYARVPLGWTGGANPGWTANLWPPRLAPLAPLAQFAPIHWLLPVIGFGVAMIVFVWGSIDHLLVAYLPRHTGLPLVDNYPGLPLLASWLLPGPSVGLMALALMIAPFSVLTFYADALRLDEKDGWWVLLRHPPVLTAFVAWILVMPSVFSLHRVRTIDPASGASRTDLPTMFKDWVDWTETTCKSDDTTVTPIIVAVSGGATRAGIWAARVLYEVESMTGTSSARIFAVSSVSGGSLGAAAYMAALAPLTPEERCEPALRRRQMALIERPELAQDALGAALAGTFLVDLPRAVFGPIVRIASGRRGGGDRAEALERGFERLWVRAVASAVAKSPKVLPPPLFSAGYLSLFYDMSVPRAGMPLWLANGTDLTSGNRLMTVPFNTATWPFTAGEDALGILQADVPISTAINNTARFPYLDPSGELVPPDPRETGAPLDQPDVGEREIIDGGYFDNSGLQTAIDLADWLRRDGPQALGGDKWKVVPVIVLATADGDILPAEKIVRCDPSGSAAGVLAGTALPWQFLVPLTGAIDQRAGHAAVLIDEVRSAYCPDDTGPVYHCDADTGPPVRCTTIGGVHQRFFHFYLPANGHRPVPLNWVLSDATARFIWNEAMNEAGNPREDWMMRQVLGALQRGSSGTPTIASR